MAKKEVDMQLENKVNELELHVTTLTTNVSTLTRDVASVNQSVGELHKTIKESHETLSAKMDNMNSSYLKDKKPNLGVWASVAGVILAVLVVYIKVESEPIREKAQTTQNELMWLRDKVIDNLQRTSKLEAREEMEREMMQMMLK